MINHACPVIVLDDVKDELWKVSHGLSYCGFPVMTQLVCDGALERKPDLPYAGVRLFFTDLHLLGPSLAKPEIYVGALITFIKQLIRPSSYVIVFWSNYAEEAQSAWDLLIQRLEPEYHPMAFKVLDKSLAENAASDDDATSIPARDELKRKVTEIINGFPQLQAVINWESSVTQAAVETMNNLLKTIKKGNVDILVPANVRDVLARMSQEALGYPYAFEDPVRGLNYALTPILQDYLERTENSTDVKLKQFLNITTAKKINLPSVNLIPLLNDFFIHAENDGSKSTERGVVIRLAPEFLAEGFTDEIGLTETNGDWQDAICYEFYSAWKNDKNRPIGGVTKQSLNPQDIYAIELSADCDYAQNKQRSHRFLIGLFVSSAMGNTNFYRENGGVANNAIYETPEITIDNVVGRLLISCRIFIVRPYNTSVDGQCVTRLRKDVVDELSHHYVTHMRRPGKISFD